MPVGIPVLRHEHVARRRRRGIQRDRYLSGLPRGDRRPRGAGRRHFANRRGCHRLVWREDQQAVEVESRVQQQRHDLARILRLESPRHHAGVGLRRHALEQVGLSTDRDRYRVEDPAIARNAVVPSSHRRDSVPHGEQVPGANVLEVRPTLVPTEQFVVVAQLVAVVTQHLRNVERHQHVPIGRARAVVCAKVEYPIWQRRPLEAVDHRIGAKQVARWGRRVGPEVPGVEPEIATDHEYEGECAHLRRESPAHGRQRDRRRECQRDSTAESTPHDRRGVGASRRCKGTGERFGHATEDSAHGQEHDHYCHDKPRPECLPGFLAFDAFGAQSGETRDNERDYEERHARGPRLLDHGHERPPELVERRGSAEANEQEEEPDAANPEHQSPPILL